MTKKPTLSTPLKARHLLLSLMEHSLLGHGLLGYSLLGLSLMSQTAHASSYQQVHDLVFNQASIVADAKDGEIDSTEVQTEKAVYLAGKLPQYPVNTRKFTKELRQQLTTRAEQTLSDSVDYYPRLDKLVHSNGICMAGSWYITQNGKNEQNQSYTGLFAQGASSPFIGRLSVALSNTVQGKPQAFGMAGKLFGTEDTTQDVTTANFFVADVLTGTKRESVFDAPMTNKPKVSLRPSLLGFGLQVGRIFSNADSNADMRPITDIARMGLAEDQSLVSPTYMMLLPYTPDNHQGTAGIDFRDEFALTPTEVANGVARYFAIYVSNQTSEATQASQAEDKGWQHIGFIKATETVVSYGCDRQLHFAHPKSE